VRFRKPCRRTTEKEHAHLDERIESAQAQRQEAAEARRVSETRAERIRKRLEQNELGKGFKAAFRAWENSA
jgi:hypothetical protein